MPGQFTRSFSEQLDRKCVLPVKEAEMGEVVRPGSVYVAPGRSHLRVTRGKRFEVLETTAAAGPSPSADVLFESAVDCYGAGVVGIVLSGMGSDGAEGTEQSLHEPEDTRLPKTKRAALFSECRSQR